MNTDNDYDEDGNNIVPCPICLNVHCASKEGGKCPEEDKFVKAMTTPETMRGKETEIREAWMKETWITEYHDRKDIADWWLALRAKELGELRDRVKRQRYEVDMEKGSEFSAPRDYRAKGYNSSTDTILAFIDELIEKP
jgi:hypothetical protein